MLGKFRDIHECFSLSLDPWGFSQCGPREDTLQGSTRLCCSVPSLESVPILSAQGKGLVFLWGHPLEVREARRAYRVKEKQGSGWTLSLSLEQLCSLGACPHPIP